MSGDDQRPAEDDAQPTDPLAAERMLGNIRHRLFGTTIDPVQVGPYTVIRRLGAGAIGTVFEAENPRLHRRVALKLVAAPPSAGPVRRALLREAQALARLEHPNVVTIYDAGIDERGLWVAMELLRGRDLQQWLRGGPRLAEVLGVLRQLADGLVAVHEAGLVHRDIKPSNAFLRDDGRVCLLDFGLAIASDETQVTVAEDDDDDGGEQLHASVPRSAIGTPAYMAPEQHRGARASAASDQYSFCVMAWEALYGARPFVADDRDALLLRKSGARLPVSPPRGAVPRALHRALLRGLAADPAARHEDMRALLEQLPAHARPRRGLGAAVLGAAALAAAIGWVSATRAAEPRCPAAAPMRSPAAHTGSAHEATPGWARLHDALVAYENALERARASTCAAAREGVIPERLADRRFACIGDLRAELALAIELAAPDDDVASTRARGWVDALDDPSACTEIDLARAARYPTPAPGLAEPVAALRERLLVVRSELRRGELDVALAGARAALRDAADVAFPALLPEAQLQLARVHRERREWAEAESFYAAAYFAAGAARHPEVGWDAAYEAAALFAGNAGEPDKAAIWLAHARAVPIDDDAYSEAAMLGLDALIRASAEDYAGALAPALAAVDGARALGDEHLFLSIASIAVVVLNATGHPRDARALAREDLDARARVVGEDDVVLAVPYHQIGIAAWELGELDESHTAFARSIAIERAHLPARAVDLALGELELGRRLLAEGAHVEAWPLLDEAATIYAELLPADHPLVISSAMARADALLERGQLELAAEVFERSRTQAEAVLGATHPVVGWALESKGRLMLARDRPSEARVLFERAMALAPADVDIDLGARMDAAALELALADAIWRAGEPHARALAIANAALARLAGQDHPVALRLAARGRSWLAAHEGTR